MLLGLVSCWLPLSLPGAGTGYRGWVVTTIGISAVGFAIAAARARAVNYESAGVLAVLGGTLGVVGTILCLWSVASFYVPDNVPPLPHLSALTGQNPVEVAQPTGAQPPTVAAAPSARIVAPIEGANVTVPELQLHANVQHIAFMLCVGVRATEQFHEQYGPRFAGIPQALTVGPDGIVSGGNATFAKLPTSMALEYSASPDGAYSLTIRDAESGLGVGCDSASDKLTDR